MAKNNIEETELKNVGVEEGTISKTEEFIENNKKNLLYAVIAIAVVVGGYFAYSRLYVGGLEKEAQGSMFKAQRYFELDSFRLALEGTPQYPGFLNIIENYGSTKSANLAEYYAGVSYLNLGEPDKAIEYLEDFDGGDTQFNALAIGLIGDAYSEKGEYDKAVAKYESAASEDDNFTAPLYLKKAGLIYEKLGKYEKALAAYKKIKSDYYASFDAMQIDKYIVRAEVRLNN